MRGVDNWAEVEGSMTRDSRRAGDGVVDTNDPLCLLWNSIKYLSSKILMPLKLFLTLSCQGLTE